MSEPIILISQATRPVPLVDDPALTISARILAALQWTYEVTLQAPLQPTEWLGFDMIGNDRAAGPVVSHFRLGIDGSSSGGLFLSGRTEGGENPTYWPAVRATVASDIEFVWSTDKTVAEWDGDWWTLRAPDSFELPCSSQSLTLTWARLPVSELWNASFRAATISAAAEPIAMPHWTSFSESIVPLIECGVVAPFVPSGALAATIQAIIEPFALPPETAGSMRIACAYQYAHRLDNDLPVRVSVPVFLVDGIDIQSKREELAKAIGSQVASWYLTDRPPTLHASLDFSVLLSVSEDRIPRPIAQFSPIPVTVDKQPLSWWQEAVGKQS